MTFETPDIQQAWNEHALELNRLVGELDKTHVTKDDLSGLKSLLAAATAGRDKDKEKLDTEEELEEETKDKNTRLKEEAARSGSFQTRDCIGQAFSKSHRPGSAEYDKYVTLKSREDKQRFRSQWALAEYAPFKKSKTKVDTWSKVDV
jgi:hypothetical protein